MVVCVCVCVCVFVLLFLSSLNYLSDSRDAFILHNYFLHSNFELIFWLFPCLIFL